MALKHQVFDPINMTWCTATRKHQVFDPGRKDWCVMARIGTFSDDYEIKIAFYSTEEECEKSVKNLQASSNLPVEYRIFRHSFGDEESDTPEPPVPSQRQRKDQINRRTNRGLV